MSHNRHTSHTCFASSIVFLTTMAFMPVVETGGVMSTALGPSRLIELGLLSFAASALTAAIIQRRCRLSLRSPAAFIVLLYGIWAMASSLWSANPVLSFGKGAELILTLFIAAALVVYLKSVVGLGSRQIRSVVVFGLLMAVAFLLLCNVVISGSLLQLTEATWNGRPGRFYLGESHPLETAELIMLTILAVQLVPRSLGARATTMTVLVLLLVLTNGRNMMLICPLVIAATIFHRGSSAVRSALAVCALSTLAVLIIFLSSGDLVRWLPDDFSTLNGRLPLWVESTDLIAQRPWLGVGYFASRNYLLDYFDFAGHAHNSYVEAALTTGMVGFGLMIITLIYATIITIRTRDTLLFGMLLLCCLGSIVNPLILLPNVTTFVFTLVLVATAEQATAEPGDFMSLGTDTESSKAIGGQHRPAAAWTS